MDVSLLIIAGLVGIGMVLVAYGTVAKNRWGINLAPVLCPRCGAGLPQFREPQNLRQRLWGGSTCPSCGTEVDKWGRQVQAEAGQPRPVRIFTKEEVRARLKRRLILAPLGYFLLNLVFGWPYDATVARWVVVLGLAAAEATLFGVLLYLASMYLFGRFVLNATRRDQTPEHGRNSGASRR